MRESMPVFIGEDLRLAEFPTHRPDMRRLYEIYLNLIEAIAFVMGFGRAVVRLGRNRDIAAIPSTQSDVDLANELMQPILRGALSQLDAAPRRLLDRLEEWLSDEAERQGGSCFDLEFTHEMAASALGLGLTMTKSHLGTLAAERWLDVQSGSRRGFKFRLCVPTFERRAAMTLRARSESEVDPNHWRRDK